MRVYLLATGVGIVLAFGLPFLFSPVRWARLFRWEIPEDVRLVRYFARCLGCTAIGIGGVSVYLGLRPDPPREFLLVGIVSTGLVAVVHLVGALERSQPWTETAEIPFWFALMVWGLVVYIG